MSKKSKGLLIACILFLLAGILWLISGVMNEGTNISYVTFGCVFVVFSIVFGIQFQASRKEKDNKKK